MSQDLRRSAHLRPFGDLVAALVEGMPVAVDDAWGASELRLTHVEIEIPFEARLQRGAEVRASLPRGRLATGFQLPHGRLTARFESTPAPATAPLADKNGREEDPGKGRE